MSQNLLTKNRLPLWFKPVPLSFFVAAFRGDSEFQDWIRSMNPSGKCDRGEASRFIILRPTNAVNEVGEIMQSRYWYVCECCISNPERQIDWKQLRNWRERFSLSDLGVNEWFDTAVVSRIDCPENKQHNIIDLLVYSSYWTLSLNDTCPTKMNWYHSCKASIQILKLLIVKVFTRLKYA